MTKNVKVTKSKQ